MDNLYKASLVSTNNGPGNYEIHIFSNRTHNISTIRIKKLYKDNFNSYPLGTLGVSKDNYCINLEYNKDYVYLIHGSDYYKLTYENIQMLLDSLKYINYICPN